MAMLSKAQEKTLRYLFRRLDAIAGAHRNPKPAKDCLPADSVLGYIARNPVAPSDRSPPHLLGSAEWYAAELHKWKLRAESLQGERDDLTRDYVELLFPIRKLLNAVDVRRANGKEGGQSRRIAVEERNANWQKKAGDLRKKNSQLSNTDIAKELKRSLRCPESIQTIRKAIAND
jgi:hypothetical protein